MGSLLNLPLVLLGLILIPVGLLGTLGLVALVFKIIAIVQKAAEPPTQDLNGNYRLEQSKEVRDDDPPAAG
jgi:hypothetical protein